MKARLDAFIAATAKILDMSLLKHNPEFETLLRRHRMHFIMANLARRDIAEAQKFGGRTVQRWRPSRRLRQNFAAKYHDFPDEFERVERPIAFSTLADEFSEVLQANAQALEDAADYVLRDFELRLR